MDNDLILPHEQTARKADLILDELFKAFRLPPHGVARRLLKPLVRKPALDFTRLFSEIEQTELRHGLAAASRRGLQEFIRMVKVSGNEGLPAQGPLLIVSNHVGAFDVLVILSQVLRNDIKVIASDIPFLHAFPVLYQHLIFTNFQAGSGMQAARQALRHLKEGGVLLLFASAGIDPDPALYPQAAQQELHNWKPSLDIFLRQIPETQVVVSIVRGIVARRWAEHPFTRIGKRPIDKRRI
ncbi:MAG: 1-acyl-sn-glycerol-3-phosphate acyltransferase, partial [Anaerolineales bacterium]|nr:1-acyl-sn-glycerol-3-phosphate acyltransferase [Anaerolineales bacterium]